MSSTAESPEKVKAARILAQMVFGSCLPSAALTYTNDDNEVEVEDERSGKERSTYMAVKKLDTPDHERSGEDRSTYKTTKTKKKPTTGKRKRNGDGDSSKADGLEIASTQLGKRARKDSAHHENNDEAAPAQLNNRVARMIPSPAASSSVGLGITFEEAVKAQHAHRRAISFGEAVKAQKVHRAKIATTPPFQLLDEICKYPDVLLYLTTQHLHPKDMLKLYSISKQYHYLINSRYTTYMLCSARRWAWLLPDTIMRKEVEDKGLWGSVSAFKEEVTVIDSSSGVEQMMNSIGQDNKGKEKARPQTRPKAVPLIFADPMQPSRPGEYNIWDITTLLPFNNYRHLCTPDPTRRTITTNDDRIRHVPTFRYLFFLLHRARIATSIISAMNGAGHRLPMTLAPSLIKLTLLMDLPTTALRLALLRNTRYFTNADLQLLKLFICKLDMLFTDPLDGDICGSKGVGSMRECLLAQRSLTTLESVLARTGGRNNMQILRMRLLYGVPVRPEHREFSIAKVEPEDIGCLRWEDWKVPRFGDVAVPLMPVDQGVVGEGERRNMELGKTHIMMMMYGH